MKDLNTGARASFRLSPQTYLVFFIYAALASSGLYYLISEFQDENRYLILSPSQNVLHNTTQHLNSVPPALRQARKVLSESNKATLPFVISTALIFIATWFLLRYILQQLLHKLEAYQPHKTPSSRKINVVFRDPQDVEVIPTFTCSDTTTNYIASTFEGSELRVSLLAFFYGAGHYLTQRIQVWCIAVGLVQVYIFGTGKSLFPLLLFTLVIAWLYKEEQLDLWRKDKERNERPVTLESNTNGDYSQQTHSDAPNVNNGFTALYPTQQHHIERGQLRPGNIIKVRPNEEVPADIILIGAYLEDSAATDELDQSTESSSQPLRRRPYKGRVFMNEVQVTGETAPVRKSLYSHELVSTVEIADMKVRKILINGGSTVDESYIAFANSTLNGPENLVIVGIVCWVGTETRALNSPADDSNTKTQRRPPPFEEYSSQGFLVSIAALLSLATLNAIVAYLGHTALTNEDDNKPEQDLILSSVRSQHSLSFGTVWVNHVMYLNMIVPQALEQLRRGVCKLLAFHFSSKVRCNNNLVVDVLSHVSRVVSDKTGTLTENKMLAKIAMLFTSAADAQNNRQPNPESPLTAIIYRDDNSSIICDDSSSVSGSPSSSFVSLSAEAAAREANAMAIFSTTGEQPEETAIRDKIALYARLIENEMPDPTDLTAGSVTYTIGRETRKLIVHVAFGFWPEFLAKSSLFQLDDVYYVGVQAGGDEFWRGIANDSVNAAKLALWDSTAQSFPHYHGAPRLWSHGLRVIDQESAQRIIAAWRASLHMPESERKAEQRSCVSEALSGVQMTSKTFMVDSYRRGVRSAIKELNKANKQVFICTGDSTKAAQTIAGHLDFPVPYVDIIGNDEDELLASIRAAQRAYQLLLQRRQNYKLETKNKLNNNNNSSSSSNSVVPQELRSRGITLFFNQESMELLQRIQQREGGFYGEHFELLIELLEQRDSKKNRFCNSAVFCRATPGLKPWVVTLLQQRHSEPSLLGYLYSLLLESTSKQHYVLAIGDGANDINMLRQSDASVGIRSGETDDVINQSAFWHTEWKKLVKLLQFDGMQKALMLSTLIKLIFLKHWMTATALFADLIYLGFPLLPMDPCNPMLMMVYNGVVFSQIASHSGVDSVADPTRLHNKTLFSMRAFLRWAIGAACSGMAATWIIRWLFPDASPHEFGAMIQVAQAWSVTLYLTLSTNKWANEFAADDNSNSINSNSVNESEIASQHFVNDDNDDNGFLLGGSTASLATRPSVGNLLSAAPSSAVLNEERAFPTVASMVLRGSAEDLSSLSHSPDTATLPLRKTKSRAKLTDANDNKPVTRTMYAGFFSLVVTITLALLAYKQSSLSTITNNNSNSDSEAAIGSSPNSLVALATVLVIVGYPSLSFLSLLNRDLKFIRRAVWLLWKMPREQLFAVFVGFSHTIHGRLLPIMIFTLAVKLVTGVSLVSLLVISALTVVTSVIIFLGIISRMGFMRAVFDGRPMAVALLALAIGVWIGRSSNYSI